MTSNAYPDKPALRYTPTTVPMMDVISYLQAQAIATEVKRAVYCLFRTESGNGSHGINENYVGAQADSGPWPAKWDAQIVGTVTTQENGTGRERIFVAFDRWQTSVDFLIDRIEARGLYIGGATHQVTRMLIATETDLSRAYHKEWVTGLPDAEPSAKEKADFLSMYSQSVALFRGGIVTTIANTNVGAPADDSADALNAAELKDQEAAGG